LSLKPLLAQHNRGGHPSHSAEAPQQLAQVADLSYFRRTRAARVAESADGGSSSTRTARSRACGCCHDRGTRHRRSGPARHDRRLLTHNPAKASSAVYIFPIVMCVLLIVQVGAIKVARSRFGMIG